MECFDRCKELDYIRKLNYLLEKRTKRRLIFVLLIIVVGSALELLGVSILLPLINLAVDAEHATDNFTYQTVDKIFATGSFEKTFIFLMLITMAVYVIKNVYLAWMNAYNEKFANDVKRQLATRLMKSYLKEPYVFFLNKNSSEIIRSVNTDTASVFQVVNNLIMVMSLGLTSLTLIVYLAHTNLMLALTVTLLLLVCVGGVFLGGRKITRRWGQENQRSNAKLIKYVKQSFEGIKEIKILNTEKYYEKQYEDEYAYQNSLLLKSKLINILPKYLIETVCVCGILFYLMLCVAQGGDYKTLVAQLAIFAVAAFKLLPYVNSIYAYTNTVIFHRASIDLVYRDIKATEGIEENVAEGSHTAVLFEKSIAVNNVSFHYQSSDKNIVENVNLEIKKGQAAAFIGPSGQGKTTMADIILGLLEPQKGEVTVDGVSIVENIRGWHDHIGYIPQFIYLSDESIRDNVAFGIEKDKINDEMVWKALEEAQLADFVKKLDNGLDTIVGERGTKLSGGQRQRIGIARALYRDPDFLVFDEATSALDNETESEVMDSINALHGAKTMLIIAHRLSTIEKCDVVYKIEDQKVTPVEGKL